MRARIDGSPRYGFPSGNYRRPHSTMYAPRAVQFHTARPFTGLQRKLQQQNGAARLRVPLTGCLRHGLRVSSGRVLNGNTGQPAALPLHVRPSMCHTATTVAGAHGKPLEGRGGRSKSLEWAKVSFCVTVRNATSPCGLRSYRTGGSRGPPGGSRRARLALARVSLCRRGCVMCGTTARDR